MHSQIISLPDEANSIANLYRESILVGYTPHPEPLHIRSHDIKNHTPHLGVYQILLLKSGANNHILILLLKTETIIKRSITGAIQKPIAAVPIINTVVPYNNKTFPACKSSILDIMRPKTSCSWSQNSAASKANEHPPRCLCASTLPLRFIFRAAFAPPWRLNSAAPSCQPSPLCSSRVHRKRTIIVANESSRPCPRVLCVPHSLSYALETALASLTVGLEIQKLHAFLSSRVFTSTRPFAKCRLTHSISAVSYSTSEHFRMRATMRVR